MAIVPSYFGVLAEQQNLQALIDNSLDVLQKESVYRRFLDIDIAQPSLTFENAIGRARIEAAASIVDPDAPAPLRSRNTLELYTGKIPAIKEKFVMNQSDMRALLSLQNLPIGDEAKKQQLIKKLWDDVSKCAVAGDKRVDIMLLQGLSTLNIDCSVTNNPDGVAYGTVSLLAKAYQKQGVPVTWASANHATSTPIDDIEGYLQLIWNSFGRKFGKILMSYNLWLNFKRSDQVIARVQSFYNIGKANASFALTVDNVNEYLISNMWPAIEIINHVTGIEKDGIITPYRPFNDYACVFIPDGKLGTLKNAFALESTMPVSGISYANFGPTLVSKWMNNDPIVEYTSMELNAFPALDIDAIFVLDTNTVQATFNTTP